MDQSVHIKRLAVPVNQKVTCKTGEKHRKHSIKFKGRKWTLHLTLTTTKWRMQYEWCEWISFQVKQGKEVLLANIIVQN